MIGLEKLILGTVKLGLPDYGVNNLNKSYTDSNFEFLKQVNMLGINHYDTAPRYGESELVIGNYINNTNINLNISTKVDNLFQNDKESINKIKLSATNSLKRLTVPKLHILYLHQNDIEIIRDKYIHEGLLKVKDIGLIKYIGASVYTINECNAAIESGIFDYIQFPLNIIDISIYNQLIKNYSGNVKFIARSIYLQGILNNTESSSLIPKFSTEISTYINQLTTYSKKLNINLTDLARSFVFHLDKIDGYIIGTRNITNLKSNISFLDFNNEKFIFNELYTLSSNEKSWSNPRNWVK